MATGERNDPYRSYRFLLEIGDIVQGGFSEVSGLALETEVVDYREGNDLPRVRKLAGMEKYTELSLKRGVTDSTELYDWYKVNKDGKTNRRAGSIVLQDETGVEKARWNFFEAWPSKWTGPTFNASSSEVAIEELVLVHEGLEKA